MHIKDYITNKMFLIGFACGGVSVIVIMLGLGYYMSARMQNAPVTLDKPDLSESRHYFSFTFPLTTIDGAPVDTGTFAGKTVLVNFFASWYRPCSAEIESLSRIADKYKDRDDFVILLISGEPRENLQRAAADQPFPLPVYHAQDIPPAYLKCGLPMTYILDANKRIVFQASGGTEWSTPDVYAFIDTLLEK